MVALLKTKPREQRHYPMGPTTQDVPLKVYDEDAADLAENQQRLAAKSWWPEWLMMALTGLVFALWLKFGR